MSGRMRSIKYLPLVSSINSVKYIRNLINYSLQKLNSIDVNLISDKHKNIESQEKQAFDSTVGQFNEFNKSNNEILLNNNSDNKLVENENQLFESAINEWTECPDNQNNNLLSKDKKSLLSKPLLTKCSLEIRTKQLISSLTTRQSSMSTILRLQELNNHLVSYPESMTLAVNQNAIQKVLRLREWSRDRVIHSHSMQILSLLGYCDPPKGRGIRILTIDGGGTRGVLVIEILRQIEKLSGKPIHQLFDLICGVSTGSIIGMLLGALQTPIDECEEYYHRFSSHLFKSDHIFNAIRLIRSHSYYDTTVWEKILKEIYSETNLIETTKSIDSPRVLAISAVMNKPSIQAFLFRNYELPVTTRSLSQYEGSSKYKIREAVRASAAAPGYFEEFTLDNYVHQDGGILINNPTAIAIHEAKMLWPNEHIQCVLSLGSGRYLPPNSLKQDNSSVSPTSLKNKLIKLIDSATDTEMVHRLLQDLMPARTYYRLNPQLTEMTTLDENRVEKLEQMKIDAQMYLRRNEYKVNQLIKEITSKRKLPQKIDDWLRLQYKLRI